MAELDEFWVDAINFCNCIVIVLGGSGSSSSLCGGLAGGVVGGVAGGVISGLGIKPFTLPLLGNN
jgi:hypothetical protein